MPVSLTKRNPSQCRNIVHTGEWFRIRNTFSPTLIKCHKVDRRYQHQLILKTKKKSDNAAQQECRTRHR